MKLDIHLDNDDRVMVLGLDQFGVRQMQSAAKKRGAVLKPLNRDDKLAYDLGTTVLVGALASPVIMAIATWIASSRARTESVSSVKVTKPDGTIIEVNISNIANQSGNNSAEVAAEIGRHISDVLGIMPSG